MAPSHICNYRRNIIKLTAKFNIFLSLSLLLLRLASAQMDTTTDVGASSCDGSYIMNGSALERNSNMVLNSLVENVGETGFNISWYGQNEDKMYGLAQCRGDMNAPTCEACASYAKRIFNEDCRRISGSIRLRGCFLRYATYNFYSKLSFTEHNAIECINTTNRTDANASGLDWSIANLLTKVINDAVSSEVGYATGNGNGIYAVAQCWRDLNMDQCRQCLNTWYKSFAHCPQGFIQGDDYNKNCVIHFATYKFYGDDLLLASPSKRVTEGKSRPNLPILLGLTIPGVVIVLLLFGGVVIWKRKVGKPLHEKPVLGYHKSTKELSTAISKSKLNFKFQILQTSTGNFNPTNKLGQGGFGSVYKGILPDGKEIAVKRLCDNTEHSVNEFFNEVNLISCVQHKNLVKLFGFSIDGINRILVYEYLPNKSLEKFLFDGNMAKVLDWERRFEIILGIASGLAYLHQGSDIRIIHRDIKASNILLDQHFKPKIADFGLVRHFSEDQTHLSTAIVGTRGYMAPEYLMHGHLTEKVDVYAFGVLVLEIITGRKNRTPSYADQVPSLLTVVWNHYLSGTLTNIIDPNLKENSQENVLQVVHIALLCTQTFVNLRPSMSEVIMFLMNKTPNLPQPTQPPFIDVIHSQLITNPIAASSLQADTNTRAASKIHTPISNFASFPDTPLSLNTISSTSFGPR